MRCFDVVSISPENFASSSLIQFHIETNYPKLVIIMSTADLKLSDLLTHPDNISLDLELRMTTEFFHYRVEMILESPIHGIQKHLRLFVLVCFILNIKPNIFRIKQYFCEKSFF